jgi:hypothetical protein
LNIKNEIFVDDITGDTLLVVRSPKHGTFLAVIDAEDAERVAAHAWCLNNRTSKNYIHFQTAMRQPDGTRKTISLHSFLTNAPDGTEVNSRVHNYLDLRKSASVIVTTKQSGEKARKQRTWEGKPTSSKFKGVSRAKRESKFEAYLKHNGVKHRLGYFPGTPQGEQDAARAYDRKALELFTHSKLNFPVSHYKPKKPVPALVTARKRMVA